MTCLQRWWSRIIRIIRIIGQPRPIPALDNSNDSGKKSAGWEWDWLASLSPGGLTSWYWAQLLARTEGLIGFLLERKTKNQEKELCMFSGGRWQDRLRTVSVSTPSVMSRSLSGPLLGEIITGGVLVWSWDNQPAPPPPPSPPSPATWYSDH